ncbi:MAG: hypothetical protein JRC66_00120 [Deltaproteobacteria bacterium]|nr:hypothetical protein [Deltaproteobacteria bacterium]
MSIYFFDFFKIPNYINDNTSIGIAAEKESPIVRATHPEQGKIKFLDGMPALC